MGDSRKEEAGGLEDFEGPQEQVRCVDPVTVAANCLLSAGVPRPRHSSCAHSGMDVPGPFPPLLY